MKTRALFLSFLIVVALIAFVGCSDDDSGTNSNGGIPSELVGEWVYDSLTVNSAEQTMADFFEWDANGVEAHFTINADSTQMYEEFDAQDSVLYYDEGTIAVSGNNATATVTSEDGAAVTPYTTFDGTWAVNSTHLLLTMVQGADTVRLYATEL